jgi:hypothetical protein
MKFLFPELYILMYERNHFHYLEQIEKEESMITEPLELPLDWSWWDEFKYQIITYAILGCALVFIFIPWAIGALSILKYFLK